MKRPNHSADRTLLASFASADRNKKSPRNRFSAAALSAARLGFAGLAASVMTATASLSESLGPETLQQTAQERTVDLELILAIDTSSSVSSQEFDLQMRGMSQAFRNEAVIGAIRASGDRGIVVAMVQWSDARKQLLAIDWFEIKDEESAERFAQEIDNTPRFLFGGGTALGGALTFAARQFEKNSYAGRRKVIDVSGDGRTNQGTRPERVRDQVVDSGITINGLAILNEDPTIDTYYRYNVIGGTGAFVMTATDYEDFSAAMLEKLIKEISGVPIVELSGPHPTQEAHYLDRLEKSGPSEEN
ncbi:DUF1194 domain-containing protein [Denitrobaculum tricleocarpae]|uniref:DUF1194 domain-containing protein n=1 Tax=Denitrobaculum tricleocarpae TaxID=2591009 RepID=A0A545TT57_9PROT|nr:DUF1194 domain-containing protein [Denitrobaculum tricleocarpae]TQV80407.1 DUF1194 domain-containing protein [Denitrobaculum tricleocarpae]